MDFDIKFEGDDRFKTDMVRIANALPGSIYQAMVQSCSLIETRAKTHHLAGATLKAHTHRLQASVKSDIRTNGKTVVGRVGSPVVYAAIHEYGGIITPKKAKFLRFQINGKWITTQKVTMPKREWLLKSLQDVQNEIETVFGRQVVIVIG